MTIYKGCPYCTAVFAIGPEEDEPLRRHIAHAHTATPEVVVVTGAGGRDADREDVEALRFRVASGDRTTRDLSLALLARQGVPVESLAEWFGLPPETVDERLDGVERSLTARRERAEDPPVGTGQDDALEDTSAGETRDDETRDEDAGDEDERRQESMAE